MNWIDSRIDSALDRLGAAVERLERVAGERLSDLGDDGESEQAARLAHDLDAMRADYETLRLTSRQASGRIDAAIGRLRAVLES